MTEDGYAGDFLGGIEAKMWTPQDEIELQDLQARKNEFVSRESDKLMTLITHSLPIQLDEPKVNPGMIRQDVFDFLTTYAVEVTEALKYWKAYEELKKALHSKPARSRS